MNKTIFESYNGLKKELENAGIEDYVYEAKLIIKHGTGYTSAQILSNYTKPLTDYQQNLLTAILKQRLIRYPLQYILGYWSFFGRDYKVGPGVLIPRPDTETVIEVCLEKLKSRENKTVLDICSGTGCIAITLALEATAEVTALEKYNEALNYLKANAEKNNAPIHIVQGDALKGDASDKKYALIVSNPPYVTKEEMKSLQPEVAFEPETALLGGDDGLLFYRAICKNYRNSLENGGTLVFEIGAAQAKDVKEIMENGGFSGVTVKKDLSGHDRVVFGTLNKI